MSGPEVPLSVEMERAADALQRFNTEYGDLYQPDAAWRPSELRREAKHRAAEEQEAVEKAAAVDMLARELFAAQRKCFPDRPDLEAWETAWGSTRQNCINLAEALVESGWRKEDA